MAEPQPTASEFLSSLTEDTIRAYASPEVFSRGEALYEELAVLKLSTFPKGFFAAVAGSRGDLYQVGFTELSEDEIDASCTCPYEYGGWCEHLVAAMLYWIDPDKLVTKDAPRVTGSLDALLAPLDRDQLLELLLKLAVNPDISAALTEFLRSSQRAPKQEKRKSPTSNSVSFIRKEVKSIFHDLDGVGTPNHPFDATSALEAVLADVFDSKAVTTITETLLQLEALTDEYLTCTARRRISDGGHRYFPSKLGQSWARALMTANLTNAERTAWTEKLSVWQNKLQIYRDTTSFAAAKLAAKEGWTQQSLVLVLAGKSSEQVFTKVEKEVAIQLRAIIDEVLEGQGRYEEAARFALSCGWFPRFVEMVAKVEDPDSLVQNAFRNLRGPNEFYQLAMEFEKAGQFQTALTFGKIGLQLVDVQRPERSSEAFAIWVRDLAWSHPDPARENFDLALKAGATAVMINPTLAAYVKVKEMAGPHWTSLRSIIMKQINSGNLNHVRASVEILIHEKQFGDALTLAQKANYSGALELAVEAAIIPLAPRAISISLDIALSIMEGKQAERYDQAVRWLDKAKRAYQFSGRGETWTELIESLIAEHKTKTKLLPLLKKLRGDVEE